MADFTQTDVVKIMEQHHIAMLTCATEDGELHSHPMTLQEVTSDGDVFMFIGLQGEQAHLLKLRPSVNLCFAEMGSWLSVAGTASFLDDAQKVDELWNEETAAWFEGGKNDPNLGLLKVDTKSAQYWGTPGGKVAAVAQFIKSKVSGERVQAQSETLTL